MSLDKQYEETRRAVAELIARERGEQLKVTHFNDASGVLWPLLNVTTQGRLILR